MRFNTQTSPVIVQKEIERLDRTVINYVNRKAKLQKLLQGKGSTTRRKTGERPDARTGNALPAKEAVIKALQNVKKPVRATDVVELVEKVRPGSNPGTVYAALSDLKRDKVVIHKDHAFFLKGKPRKVA